MAVRNKRRWGVKSKINNQKEKKRNSLVESQGGDLGHGTADKENGR